MTPDLTPSEVAPTSPPLVMPDELLENEKCDTCRFYLGWDCRRHSPTIAENGFAQFPRIAKEDWCGDYVNLYDYKEGRW